MRRIVLLAALVAALPASASAQAPAGPPGPPPGNGLDLPAPPGTALPAVPAGTPGTIPSGATGPGLLSGAPVRFAKRRFALPLACQAGGRVSVQGRGVRGGTFAQKRYTCAGNRATVRFTVKRKAAKRIKRRGVVPATATVRQGSGTYRLAFDLRARRGSPAAKTFWTDGNLACDSGGPGTPAYLVEPNFTAPGTTTVSTRGWVAWHTAAGGWHWLGVDGENAGRWDAWTATPQGIAQFFPPGSTQPQRYSWGPITAPAGQGITAIGVWEIVYWVSGQPNYSWQYVNAGPTGAVAAGGGTLFCTYP